MSSDKIFDYGELYYLISLLKEQNQGHQRDCPNSLLLLSLLKVHGIILILQKYHHLLSKMIIPEFLITYFLSPQQGTAHGVSRFTFQDSRMFFHFQSILVQRYLKRCDNSQALPSKVTAATLTHFDTQLFLNKSSANFKIYLIMRFFFNHFLLDLSIRKCIYF